MTVLYLLGSVLVAAKVSYDLDAFTKESTRLTDALAFLVVLLFLLILAFGLARPVPALSLPSVVYWV